MNKGTVLVVLISEYADWEIALLAAGLRWGFGMWQKTYEVKIVSATEDYVHSLGGLTVVPDYSFENAPTEFSALLLIGGTNWFGQEGLQALPLIQMAMKRKVTIGAICDASVFLAAHGFLNNIKHTSTSLTELKRKAGVAYRGEDKFLECASVQDGHIITAKPTGYLEFTRDVLRAMKVASEDKLEEFYKICKPIP